MPFTFIIPLYLSYCRLRIDQYLASALEPILISIKSCLTAITLLASRIQTGLFLPVKMMLVL